MNPPLFHNCIRKVCGLVAATLILPALAYAQNNQGNDRIVGSWIVHATIPPSFHIDALQAFLENGIMITTGFPDGTGYGVWQKTGSAYFAKFIWLLPPEALGPGEPPGTIRTSNPGPLTINPQGTEITGPFHGFDTDPNGNVIAAFSGTVVFDRISFTSNP